MGDGTYQCQAPLFLFGGERGWLVDGGARHWRREGLVGDNVLFKKSPFFLFQDKHRLVGATYTRCKSLVGCDFDNFV